MKYLSPCFLFPVWIIFSGFTNAEETRLPTAAVQGIKGVKEDAPVQVKDIQTGNAAPNGGVTANAPTGAQGVNKVNGVETINGVKADGRVVPPANPTTPPPPPLQSESHQIPLDPTRFFFHAPTAPSARGTGNRAQVAGRQWNSSLPESSAREMKPNQGSSSQIKAAFFPLPPANHPNRLAIGEAAFYRHPLPFARTGPPHGFAAHFLNHTS